MRPSNLQILRLSLKLRLKNDPEIVGRLAVVEHNRWIMEKVLKGFQLPDDPGQYFRKADDTTHSEKDHWHVCLLPCGDLSRLTPDDLRADPVNCRLWMKSVTC